ncbi:MAG: hypothetical protein EOO09_13210 [Chitinophagaceae bacterium]|nr:MAG: hypothetical protein EOO09_13210 [Chitinophagaceae bacterium]
MKKSMIKITWLVIVLLGSVTMKGQTVLTHLAKDGYKGIFVLTGDHIPKVNSALTGYTIERRAVDEKEFRLVTTLNAVTSVDEFREKANASVHLLPYNTSTSRFRLDSIWKKSRIKQSLLDLGAVAHTLPVLAGLNMIWVDSNVQEGKSYTYRVTGIGERYQVVSIPVVYTTNDTLAGLLFERGMYNQPQQRMELYWTTAGKDKPVFIEAYRSENNGDFRKIDAVVSVLPVKDTLQYLVTDTTAKKGGLYEYYVKGYDEFGNAGRNSATQAVAALDYVQMMLPEMVRSAPDSLSKGIRISWELKDASYIKMLSLYRSTNSVDGFRQVAVLSVDSKEYVDEEVQPATPYFYYFEAEYKTQSRPKRSTAFAASFSDSTAPANPSGLVATVTKEGIRIDWEYAPANTRGFWLYRSERGAPLQLVSKLISSDSSSPLYSFTDTDSLLSGGRYYQYALKAYSTSHIESGFSDTVVARPMKNTPVPRSPMKVTVTSSDDKVFVFWDDVSAYDRDVAGYLLLRSKRNPGTKGAFTTDTITCSSNMYTDSLSEADGLVRYSVITQSVFGTASVASGWFSLHTNPIRPVPPSSVRVNPVKTGIHLNWEPVANPGPSKYNIYRYERGAQPVKAGTVTGEESVYIDGQVTKGKHYFYFIRTVTATGAESERSNEAGINF